MRIALGVSGGVAAYKAAELVRRLQQDGLDVQVIMTASAQEFVTPLTFAALTGQKVITDMFGHEPAAPNVESAIEHIAVAQRIDALVVAPATANTLAKMARGAADDFLTTLYLATTAPVIVAPAMNVNMWEHAATQENIALLRARGVHVVAPEEGYLACGMTGRPPGRNGSHRRNRARRARPAPRSRRRIDPDHRRSYARRYRSGALPHQSLLRQNGLRAWRLPPCAAARTSRWSADRSSSPRRRGRISSRCAAPNKCIAPCLSICPAQVS
jgi:3-polyprenyl-4-hydroxybenzoate decarboxylase